jgi:hypothetical protein
MKQKYIKIILSVLCLLTPYLAFAFIGLELNPAKWYMEFRALFIFIMTGVSGLILYCWVVE